MLYKVGTSCLWDITQGALPCTMNAYDVRQWPPVRMIKAAWNATIYSSLDIFSRNVCWSAVPHNLQISYNTAVGRGRLSSASGDGCVVRRDKDQAEILKSKLRSSCIQHKTQESSSVLTVFEFAPRCDTQPTENHKSRLGVEETGRGALVPVNPPLLGYRAYGELPVCKGSPKQGGRSRRSSWTKIRWDV